MKFNGKDKMSLTNKVNVLILNSSIFKGDVHSYDTF